MDEIAGNKPITVNTQTNIIEKFQKQLTTDGDETKNSSKSTSLSKALSKINKK